MPSFGNYDPSSFGWLHPPATGDVVPFVHRGVPFPGGVHVLAVPLFRAALNAVLPALPGGLVAPGCWGFDDRPVRDGTALSFHAYGLALDINAPTNPAVTQAEYDAGTRSKPHTLADDTGTRVRPYGMEWGGDWTRRDYMHLELHLSPDETQRQGGHMADVLDYSSGFPAPAAVKAAGYQGVVRYIGTPGRGKNLTRAEAQQMTAAGVPIALVYEDTAGWMNGGAAAGAAAAWAALADAASCGVQVRCVYLACDVDVTSTAQMATVMSCLDGAAGTELGRARTGVYGEADVIDAALSGGHAAYGWQTRAWSGGRVSARAAILQQIGYVAVGGVQCDRSTVLNDDWGQWPYQGGGDVPITQDDANLIMRTFNIGAMPDHGAQLDGFAARIADMVKSRGGATAAQVQAVATALATNATAITAGITDAKTAVLAGLATLPTAHLTDEDRAAIAQAVADRLPDLEAGEVEAALRHVFAELATPDQPSA